MHGCAPDKDRICLVYIFCFLIIPVELLQAAGCDGIQAMIFVHYRFSSSNFFMNATSASTPSMGIAL